MWPNVYNGSALSTWTTERQFGLTTTPNLKLILWYHDRIEIDTSFSVMAVTPQTPKCHHNLGCASVVVTFGSLWCHSHDLKLGINSFNHFMLFISYLSYNLYYLCVFIYFIYSFWFNQILLYYVCFISRTVVLWCVFYCSHACLSATSTHFKWEVTLLKGLRMVARALWRSEARRVVPWSETLHEP